MYDIKAYFEAANAEEAVCLLRAHPDACIIAGGSDVLVQIRDGKRKNAELVSIRGIEALRGVSRTPDGTIRIGALTSFARLGKDPVILECIPPLAEAACQIGSPQIRNIGTLGGNICNASPTADTPPTLLAWDAQLELFGPEGTRRIPLQDFYLGSKAVDKKPEELLTAVLIPAGAYRGFAGKMVKYAAREALDTSIVNCSVSVRLSEDGERIEKARAAFGGALGQFPARASSAEAAATGQYLNGQLPALFADAFLQDIHPRDGWRASRALRVQIAGELAKRVFLESVKRAGGVIHE